MKITKIDCEKIADGIESGFDPYNCSRIFRKYLLRGSFCGISSIAVRDFFRNQNIPAEIKLAKPCLEFDSDLEHVLTIVNDDERDPLIVDPTYSQFLSYTGMTIYHDYLSRNSIYQAERVIAFRQSQSGSAVRHVAKIAFGLIARKEEIVQETGLDWGDNIFRECESEKEIMDMIRPIWDLSNYSRYYPSEADLAKGKEWSTKIDSSAIEINSD